METIEFFERVFKDHEFFDGMTHEHLATLAGCAKNVRFRVGETIFRQHENADAFYIIREGQVAVDIESADRGVITVQTLGKGEVLGWSWLFPPYIWNFDARVTEETRAIALDGKCLRGKCETDNSLGYELMKRFSSIVLNRLQATRIQLMDIYGPGVKT